MFLIIWAMKIVLYPEYHHLPHVIKLKIKFSILCSRSSEARVTLESHEQKTKHRHHRTTPITCSGFHFVCILKSCCELNPSQTL